MPNSGQKATEDIDDFKEGNEQNKLCHQRINLYGTF